MRRVSSLSADLSCSLALCTGIAIRVLFSVGRDYGAENPRLGRVVPSFLAVARHLLRLCIPLCLAAAYFHPGASRWLRRCLSLGQGRPPFCRGYRYPVDYPGVDIDVIQGFWQVSFDSVSVDGKSLLGQPVQYSTRARTAWLVTLTPSGPFTITFLARP